MNRNWGCRLSADWRLKGMRTVLIENELLQIGVLADKGSEIFRFLYKPMDVDFLYLRDGGVQNPARDVPSVAGSGGAFLDYYSGGWQEILPNGGGPATYRGAEFGQHGEVSLVPWDFEVTEDSPERVAVRFSVRCRRVPLRLEKTLSLNTGEAVLHIEERLENVSGETIELMWGHHPAFGGVMLEPGCRVWAPAKRVLVQGEMPGAGARRLVPGSEFAWPMGEDREGKLVDFSEIPAPPAEGALEMAYLTELEEGWYAVVNPMRSVGFAMAWDRDVFPYLWFWQEFGAGKGYPWWGGVHTYALEPWTSYPTNGLEAAVANGTALKLTGGESVTTSLTATAFRGVDAVGRVTPDGHVIALSK